jgi:epidermal growth factor receptor substrate 15
MQQIRLPFGRKKKKTEEHQPPIPQGFLSPVSEPVGATTPAVEDDVEPVKQLCGMGFSRSQVVTALEQNGYDVQKALNQLVGTV